MYNYAKRILSAQHGGAVALHGASAGSLYAAGRAAERFGVRNSGAHALTIDEGA